ncbi:MAG: MFS transporter [Chloroherpetonaceae bacterium]|nr:MFS transporter [Chloroherpetonaceae bacterium]
MRRGKPQASLFRFAAGITLRCEQVKQNLRLRNEYLPALSPVATIKGKKQLFYNADVEDCFMTGAYQRAEIAVVYAVAFFQGIGNVAFPASATLFKSHHGLSDSEYGFLYLPMITCAIVSSLSATWLVHRMALKTLLVVGIVSYAVAQGLLALSFPLQSYKVLLWSIAVLGVGFGYTGAAVNFYPTQFFPLHRDAAIIFVHAAFGTGATLAPLLLSWVEHIASWVAYPTAVAALMSWLAAKAHSLPLRVRMPIRQAERKVSLGVPFGLWLFCVVAVLYALCESTFANWSVIFLREAKGLSDTSSQSGLSLFWLALTVGRIAASAVSRRVGAEKIYLSHLPVIAIAFLLAFYSESEIVLLVSLFVAGLGCSAFFPLNVSLAMKYFPEQAAATSGLMSACVMLGIGIAAYGIAPLRAYFDLEQIYLFSVIYPLAALLIAGWLIKKFACAKVSHIVSSDV